MFARLKIALYPDEMAALEMLARQERRRTDAMAAVLVKQALVDRGLLEYAEGGETDEVQVQPLVVVLSGGAERA